MKRILSALCCISLLVIVSYSTSSCSNSSKGTPHTMVLKKGKVAIASKEGTKTYSSKGEQITVYDKEHIKTGADARVLVKDQATAGEIEVYANSQLRIMQLETDAAKIKLDKGKARFLLYNNALNSRRMKINTANALIGVKGTEFVVDSTETGTNLLTVSGAVNLANITSPDDEVTVTANQVSRVQVARLPAEPVSVSKEAIQEVLTSDQPDSFKKVKFGPIIPGNPNAFSYLDIRPKSKSNQLFWAKLDTSTKFDIHWTTNPNKPVPSWQVIKGVSNGYIHKGLIAGKTYYYTVSFLNDADRRTYYVVKSGQPKP